MCCDAHISKSTKSASESRENSLFRFTVTEATDSERVRILQFERELRLGEVLEADRTDEAVDGEAADGREARVGGGGVGASVDHGMRNFDARGEAVEDDAAGPLLEEVDEFAVGREVLFVPENRRGEMAGEGAGGLEVVLCGTAADEERVGAEDLIGEFRLAQEFVESNSKQLGLCVKWLCDIAGRRQEVRLGGE